MRAFKLELSPVTVPEHWHTVALAGPPLPPAGVRGSFAFAEDRISLRSARARDAARRPGGPSARVCTGPDTSRRPVRRGASPASLSEHPSRPQRPAAAGRSNGEPRRGRGPWPWSSRSARASGHGRECEDGPGEGKPMAIGQTDGGPMPSARRADAEGTPSTQPPLPPAQVAGRKASGGPRRLRGRPQAARANARAVLGAPPGGRRGVPGRLPPGSRGGIPGRCWTRARPAPLQSGCGPCRRAWRAPRRGRSALRDAWALGRPGRCWAGRVPAGAPL